LPAKSIKLSSILKAESVSEKKFGKKLVFLVTTKEKEAYFQATSESDYSTLLHYLGQQNPTISSSDH